MTILSVEYDIVRCFCAPGDSKLMFCFSKHVQLFICDRSYRSWWPRINLFPLLLSTSEFFSCLYKTWLIQKSPIFMNDSVLISINKLCVDIGFICVAREVKMCMFIQVRLWVTLKYYPFVIYMWDEEHMGATICYN